MKVECVLLNAGEEMRPDGSTAIVDPFNAIPAPSLPFMLPRLCAYVAVSDCYEAIVLRVQIERRTRTAWVPVGESTTTDLDPHPAGPRWIGQLTLEEVRIADTGEYRFAVYDDDKLLGYASFEVFEANP